MEQAEVEERLKVELQIRLRTKIWSSFEDKPLEDGYSHPAELILADCLEGAADAQERIHTLMAGSRTSHRASILRCLGRLEAPGDPRWREDLVREALSDDDIEIRDAAIQTIEHWEEPTLVQLLRAHDERIPWLDDYAKQVVRDLTG